MLPDAHTNVFKLVDLPGIKWTKYSFANTLPCLPGDDAILSAFAKCMREGILCTWRRPMENAAREKETPSSEHKKELWCFWCGDKPALLGNATRLFSCLAGDSAGLSTKNRKTDRFSIPQLEI